LVDESELQILSNTGKLKARVRSSCEEIPCEITGNTVKLSEKIAFISPGQAAVFYNETQMLGGGYIEKIVG
jgi:tRNA U34 2-thiouridine synthase MnmA/TrmU